MLHQEHVLQDPSFPRPLVVGSRSIIRAAIIFLLLFVFIVPVYATATTAPTTRAMQLRHTPGRSPRPDVRWSHVRRPHARTDARSKHIPVRCQTVRSTSSGIPGVRHERVLIEGQTFFFFVVV